MGKLINYIIILSSLIVTTTFQSQEDGYCEIGSETCETPTTLNNNEKYIFYDINPPEGFNLRRDVYMRLAVALTEAQKKGKYKNWKLVLPPWYRLYHWRKSASNSRPFPWSSFFDLKSLKSYAPVVELEEVFSKMAGKKLEIDVLYVIKNYFTEFLENQTFEDLWEITDENCEYDGEFWGYHNISVKETLCLKFQGSASTLLEVLSLHPKDSKIMFHHAEIPLHDHFGNKAFWDCRKSMKFAQPLTDIARTYIDKHLDCPFSLSLCNTYISVHLRRRDFTIGHRNDIPSIKGAAEQIHKFIKKSPNIRNIFVATDSENKEKAQLKTLLSQYNYDTYFYEAPNNVLKKYGEGGVAIIDQIICAHAAVFIGTHESTFSHRIEQEREILGFKSSTTFNRLCPDKGPCEKPSKWTIVH